MVTESNPDVLDMSDDEISLLLLRILNFLHYGFSHLGNSERMLTNTHGTENVCFQVVNYDNIEIFQAQLAYNTQFFRINVARAYGKFFFFLLKFLRRSFDSDPSTESQK